MASLKNEMMITQKISYKVPHGKLLKAEVIFDSEHHILESVKLSGDFFVYPEEKFVLLEQALFKIKYDYDAIMSRLKEIIDREHIQLFGLDVESITMAVLQAYLKKG